MRVLVEGLQAWINAFEWFVLAYFLILNSTYLLLTVLASVEFLRYFRRAPFAGNDDVFVDPSTPGVSIIVAAFNEKVGIVDNVRAILSLRYPKFEVLVIDDGSTDSTFALLRTEFDLVLVPRHAEDVIPLTGEITSVHVARQGGPLIVVRKRNASDKSDAVNAGLNVATMPLVCMVDADSLLDPEALLRVAKPFLDDPDHVVATGGVIRPANGCVVDSGTIVMTGMPTEWLARVQVIEYLRGFLLGRTGWSSLHCMLIMSGAFGMFRRDLVLQVGGMDRNCLGEDAELMVRIHRRLREQGRRNYRVVFVSEPVCWTEVPSTTNVLARQRRRWSRGLAEVLWKHKKMMFNPRYGRIGMVALPYYLIFELLGPLVEIVGLITVVSIFMAAGLGEIFHFQNWLINTNYAALYLIVGIGYGFFLSLAALAVEEFSFHRMTTWKDLARSLAASVVENVGYRQMHCWWRLQGLLWWLTKREAKWGDMPRTGYINPELTPAEEKPQ